MSSDCSDQSIMVSNYYSIQSTTTSGYDRFSRELGESFDALVWKWRSTDSGTKVIFHFGHTITLFCQENDCFMKLEQATP